MSKTTPAKRVTKPPVAQNKLDAAGIDEVCSMLGMGKSLTGIAQEFEISVGSLLTWVEADSERSARVKLVRASMSRHWDEKAESMLAGAGDDFDLRKAKELAHHYRWRASKIAPREYGDKIQTELTGPNGGAVQFTNLTTETLDARIAELSAKLGNP